MDFELPVEHQLAYESAFNFARDEIRPHNAEIERTDDFPPWIWKRLAEQGYTGIAIPEEYGGSEGDFLMAALVARPIARATSAAIRKSPSLPPYSSGMAMPVYPCSARRFQIHGGKSSVRSISALWGRISSRAKFNALS